MSELERLIQELCPNGVPYRTLNTICNIFDGTHQTPKYTDSGIKFASVENISNPYATEKHISVSDYEKYKIKPQRNDLLMTRIGSIGVCAVIESDEPLAYYVSLALLRPNQEVLNSRYLKYAMESLHCRKELRKRTLVNAVPIKINMGDIGKITLPVPPIEVQREIVRILDKFTELTAELTAELTKELTARKKQYDYYLEKLLFSAEDTKMLTLGEVSSFYNGDRGKNYPKVSEMVEEGIPFVNAGDINGTVDYINCNKITREKYLSMSGAKLKKGDILYCLRGSTGKNGIYELDEGTVASSLVAIRANNLINYKFLYYLLNSSMERSQRMKYDTGAAQPNLSAKNVREYVFPVPSLEEQERIVAILDRFDSICNDISAGLPAEIEARQKQYEYYRDKLLNFKEMSV